MTRRRLTPAILALALAGCTPRKPAPATDRPASPITTPTANPRSDGGAPSSTPAPKPDPAGLMAKVDASLKAGNLPAALAMLREITKADPDNRRALGLIALISQNIAGQTQRPLSTPLYLESSEALRRLLSLGVELTPDEKAAAPFILYNEACTLAINGEIAQAMRILAASFDAGFNRVDKLDTDSELDALRNLPAFQALQRRQERRATELLLSTTRPYAIDFRLPDTEGKVTTLADVKGEITLLSFWGTWCLPCRKQVPILVELAGKFRDRGLRVVGLNHAGTGDGENRETVRSFVKEHGITYPCLSSSAETLGKVRGFQGYPTLLFLDRQGQVRLQIVGFQSLATLEVMMNTLLDEAAAGRKGQNPPAKASQ